MIQQIQIKKKTKQIGIFSIYNKLNIVIYCLGKNCTVKQGLVTGSRGWLIACKPPEDAHE